MVAPKNSVAAQILNQRKLRILDLLAFKGEFTRENKTKILGTNKLSSLKEFYDSHSSSYQTRGSIAIKKGLDPLATILWRQEKNVVPQDDALAFIDHTYQINSRDEALTGARDIIAERIRDTKETKQKLESLVKSYGSLNLETIKEDHPELPHYKKYLNGSNLRLTKKINHTFKILEAENKGILSLSISLPHAESLDILKKFFIRKDTAASQQVRMAIEESYYRFLLPYLEMEIRTQILEGSFQKTLEPPKNISHFWITVFILLVLLTSTFILQTKPDGIVKKYYPHGQMKSIEGYSNGKRDGGFRKFLPNGQIVFLATYKNGVLNGESREYYANGEWKTIKNYQDGKLEGFFRRYDQQGRLEAQVYYHKNIPLPK